MTLINVVPKPLWLEDLVGDQHKEIQKRKGQEERWVGRRNEKLLEMVWETVLE